MRALRRFEARDVVAEHARQLRLRGHMAVETLEDRRQRRLDHDPEFAQQGAGSLVDAHEAQPASTILIHVGCHGVSHGNALQSMRVRTEYYCRVLKRRLTARLLQK